MMLRVMIRSTGVSSGRPGATQRVRMSRSVRIPAGSFPSISTSEETLFSVISRAAFWMEMSGCADTTGPLQKSPV